MKERRMAKTVYVNKDECTSCGLCADDLPDVFTMDDDDLAEVSNPKGASEEEIQQVMDDCPGECILWKDE